MILPPFVKPAALAAQAVASLQALADRRIAAQSQAFFKAHESLTFYGVNTPTVRKLAKELYAQVRGTWQLRDALKCCDLLLNEREQEARSVGIELLAHFHKTYDAAMHLHFERWFTRNRCDNWALTDALSCMVVAKWLKRFPEQMTYVAQWAQADNLWLRRASAVALVPLAKQSEWHTAIFAQAERLLTCPEDLMHKAVGWLLREAGKADGAALRKFLTTHGSQMARTSLRYAIERFPADERKAWLLNTRHP